MILWADPSCMTFTSCFWFAVSDWNIALCFSTGSSISKRFCSWQKAEFSEFQSFNSEFPVAAFWAFSSEDTISKSLKRYQTRNLKRQSIFLTLLPSVTPEAYSGGKALSIIHKPSLWEFSLPAEEHPGSGVSLPFTGAAPAYRATRFLFLSRVWIYSCNLSWFGSQFSIFQNAFYLLSEAD